MKRATAKEISKLKAFYEREPWLKKERRIISEIITELSVYIIFLLIYAVVRNEGTKPLMFYVFMLYFGLRGEFRTKKEEKIQNRYKKLDVNQFEKVQLGVSTLAAKMGLKRNLSIYYNKNNHFIPNILESKYGSIILILPRNLFYLFNKQRDHFDAIIAHEFSHIIKSDTKLWWDFQRYRGSNDDPWIRYNSYLDCFRNCYTACSIYSLLNCLLSLLYSSSKAQEEKIRIIC